MGDILDSNSPVYSLVKKWQVGLMLKPEYGAKPNVFYVPPLSPCKEDEQGRPLTENKIPMEYLERLFGKGVKNALDTLTDEREKKRQGNASKLMDLLIAPTSADLFVL
jgi:nitrate reductase beta subunit